MGTTLTGTTPQDTYDSLIKVTDNGPLSGTAKYLSDGLGNDSILALSTSKVGIGTTTPNSKLDILQTSNAEAFRVEGAAGGFAFLVDGGTSYRTIMRNASIGNSYGGTAAPTNGLIVEGNVGIGTSAPTRPLTIQGPDNGEGQLRLQGTGSTTSYSEIGRESLSTGQFRIKLSRNGTVITPLVIDDTTGNVGIGTSAPASKLHVQSGALQVSGNSIDTVISYSTVGIVGTTTAHDLQIIRNSTEICRVTANGLTFNGDTAAANALDDYEEGTFTPTFAGSTTNPTVTYAAQLGTYTKIGRQVTVSIELGTSANTGGVGTIQIAGLPFTVGVRSYMSVATYNIDNTAATPLGIFAEINAGGTNLSLLQAADNAAWASMNWTQATSSAIYVNATITYFV